MTSNLLMQVLPFVHPGIAGIAVATGLIPILIHLINRRRFVRVPWAAMSFLVAANRRSVRRLRLEQFLLLATRVVIIVLLGLAIARPFLPSTSLLPVKSSRVHRIILLDNSLSMSARAPDGATRFELARQAVQRLLDSFPENDAVSVVTLARPADPIIESASFDRRFVREQLAAIEPTQRGTDALGALAAATDILNNSPTAPGNRSVYLVSDLSRSVWQAGAGEPATGGLRGLQRLADLLPHPALDLTIVPTAPPIEGNVAVTGLSTDTPLLGINTPARLSATITNFSETTARDVGLQLRLDGRIIRRDRIPHIDPGASTVATITTLFSTVGTHLVEARLTETASDGLPDDNTRYLSVDVRDSAPILLVDGRPGATRLAGQAGFLATALAPRSAPGDPTLLAPKIITDTELYGEALSSYDLIALCNVQRLALETWRQLESFAADGGGLLIFAGDLVSIDNYNRFGHANGAGLLPGTWAPATTAETAAPVGLVAADLTHPIVRDFVSYAESGLFVARVDRYLPMVVDRDRGETVLRYTTGDPALVASRFGEGHVVVCTTTANMDWTNLPAKGDYVSLMVNTASFLSPTRGTHRNIPVGDILREPLTPAQSSLPLRVTSSDGSTDTPALVADHEAMALTYGPIERARVIQVSIGPDERTFASYLDPAESDLRTIEGAAFLALLGRPARLVEHPSPSNQAASAIRSTELASLSTYLVCGLLFLEMTMAMSFGSGVTSQRHTPQHPTPPGTSRHGT